MQCKAITIFKPYLSLLWLLGLLSLAGCEVQPSKSHDEVTFKIAANLPLTGVLSRWGQAIRTGTSFALEHSLSPEERKRFAIDWQDNQSRPQEAVTIMREQLQKSPHLYISGLMPQTLAIRDEINRIGLPHFVWMFSPQIDSGAGNNFRTLLHFGLEPKLFLDFAREHRPKRVAIIHVLLAAVVDEYEKDVIPGLRRLGITEVLTKSYAMDQMDFTSIIDSVRTFDPDLVILSGFSHNMVGLLKAVSTRKLKKNRKIIASFDLIDATKDISAADLEGILVSAPQFLTRMETLPRVQKWFGDFEQEYGESPFYVHVYAYEMGLVLSHLIQQGARRPDVSPTSSSLIKQLQLLRIPGLTTDLTFAPGGSLETLVELGEFRDGRLLPYQPKTTGDERSHNE